MVVLIVDFKGFFCGVHRVFLGASLRVLIVVAKWF